LIADVSRGLIILGVAVAAFVGSHFVLSHALRRALINSIGQAGFRAIYSVVALALLIVILLGYHMSPSGPMLWTSDNLALQIGFAVVGYFAVTLFVASLFGNPGLVGANLNGLSTRAPDGVYLITRHPMMFAIAIWCVAQVALVPSPRNAIPCAGFVVLAIVGARMQDRKNAALSGREWTLWMTRTPFWPDLRHIGGLGTIWLIAAIPWVLVTWLETRVTFTPIGLWYFVPDLPY